jgi:hypothetical protein
LEVIAEFSVSAGILEILAEKKKNLLVARAVPGLGCSAYFSTELPYNFERELYF